MLTDGSQTAIGAGDTVNIFLGRPIEFIGVASACRLFLVSDAASVTAQVLINTGGVQSAPIASGMAVNASSAAGEGPKEDEDRVADFAIPAGSRLQCNVTNNGGSTVNIRFRAIITP